MKKKIIKIVLIVVGVVAMLLGLLWFLQGTAIIQMCPILCFANCECLTGGSLLWEIIGLVVFFIGIIIIYFGLRRSRIVR
jgi:uncharacterized BrkB/YihY/UPF0761 family membrane protein